MIIDKLENAGKYLPDNADGRAVLKFLEENDLNGVALGKHALTDKAFVNVTEYDTKPLGNVCPEAHIKYVDLQVIITGSEDALYALLDGQPVIKPYDEESEYALYSANAYTRHTVKAGEFALLFPEHLHQFGIATSQPIKIKKAIFKIPVWER